MTQASVAIIGLGQMGSALAAHLQEHDIDLIGWDHDAKVRQRLATSGIPVAGSLAEAVAGRAFVLSSLPNGQAVRQAWLGPHGIVALAHSKAVIIELSTIEPAVMQEVAAAAGQRGLAVLDCPVSGGPVEARAGKLIVMVGGDKAITETAMPILRLLGETICPTGGVGTAKVVKLINNMMAMGNLLIACEAFALGEKAGVESATLFSVLAESGGRSHTFLKRFPPALQGDFAARFKLELADKDLGLGLKLAESQQFPLPALAQVKAIFGRALQEGHGQQDAVALLAMYRD